jgi:hypothetical protein
MDSILTIDHRGCMAPDPKVQRSGTPKDLSFRFLESRNPEEPKLISTIDQEMTPGGKRENLR